MVQGLPIPLGQGLGNGIRDCTKLSLRAHYTQILRGVCTVQLLSCEAHRPARKLASPLPLLLTLHGAVPTGRPPTMNLTHLCKFIFILFFTNLKHCFISQCIPTGLALLETGEPSCLGLNSGSTIY